MEMSGDSVHAAWGWGREVCVAGRGIEDVQNFFFFILLYFFLFCGSGTRTQPVLDVGAAQRQTVRRGDAGKPAGSTRRTGGTKIRGGRSERVRAKALMTGRQGGGGCGGGGQKQQQIKHCSEFIMSYQSRQTGPDG